MQSFMPYYMLNRNNLFSFLGENDKAERGCRAMPNYSSYFIIYNISHIVSHKCMSDIYTQVESRSLYSVNILHECKHKRHSCLTVFIAFTYTTGISGRVFAFNFLFEKPKFKCTFPTVCGTEETS